MTEYSDLTTEELIEKFETSWRTWGWADRNGKPRLQELAEGRMGEAEAELADRGIDAVDAATLEEA